MGEIKVNSDGVISITDALQDGDIRYVWQNNQGKIISIHKNPTDAYARAQATLQHGMMIPTDTKSYYKLYKGQYMDDVQQFANIGLLFKAP